MAIERVSGNGSAGEVGFQTLNFSGLSPEMMLAFMQSSMQALDGQIAGILDDMNARRGQMAEINEGIRQLRNLEARARDSSGDSIDVGTQLDPDAAAREEELRAAIRAPQNQGFNGGPFNGPQQWNPQAAVDAVQAQAELHVFQLQHQSTTVEGVLEGLGFDQETIDAVVNEDGDIHADDIKGLIEQLDSRLAELNDTTEYDSMRVGALMSKRSQMIQLTSNIMRDLNETSKAVIQNI